MDIYLSTNNNHHFILSVHSYPFKSLKQIVQITCKYINNNGIIQIQNTQNNTTNIVPSLSTLSSFYNLAYLGTCMKYLVTCLVWINLLIKKTLLWSLIKFSCPLLLRVASCNSIYSSKMATSSMYYKDVGLSIEPFNFEHGRWKNGPLRLWLINYKIFL
jgi:hypothetical protein